METGWPRRSRLKDLDRGNIANGTYSLGVRLECDVLVGIYTGSPLFVDRFPWFVVLSLKAR